MEEHAESLPRFAGAVLESAFARRFPEMAVPFRAARPESPELVELTEPLARELGLDPAALREERGVRFLIGNALAAGSEPVAQAYAGHQFGGYSPRLGDGRALLLGEIAVPGDPTARRVDLHLKGSGRTPFARADGFAALGPMLRELLFGEAMHALGVPTSRALAVVATGRRVRRDAELLPGAVLARVAASHLRVGSFQYARASGDLGLLARLVDFAIERHVPEGAGAELPARALLAATVRAQADLVARWMLVGFVHGVMNTDNTTISGETIDYGPCAFIDVYDPEAVFSSIDHGGRYAYGRQPGIAGWNLTRFAETLLPLLAPEPDAAEEIALAELGRYPERFTASWDAGMRVKLGIAEAAQRAGMGDDALAELTGGLLDDLRTHRIDYTLAFRELAEAARGDAAAFRARYPGTAAPGAWFARWLALDPDAAAMDRVNPVVIPRNHVVDPALDAAESGEPGPFRELLAAVRTPFAVRPGGERFAAGPPPGAPRHVTFCGT
ncbi:YdiU family protein [Leucobacter allii]|uniref:protein adenylyltransferase SelO n=1 Tax=Leucobacter allii TaxID=2932247 RepID=UPI001FCFD7F7|nr:YdiU family protein [Leucobacter allii]UOR02538.1 YdiU family protein [Leucobacter allii]